MIGNLKSGVNSGTGSICLDVLILSFIVFDGKKSEKTEINVIFLLMFLMVGALPLRDKSDNSDILKIL